MIYHLGDQAINLEYDHPPTPKLSPGCLKLGLWLTVQGAGSISRPLVYWSLELHYGPHGLKAIQIVPGEPMYNKIRKRYSWIYKQSLQLDLRDAIVMRPN